MGQTVKRTPCIILHTSWIPGEREYGVGGFRVLDIYKYTQRLLKAACCCLGTFAIPAFLTHPHPPEKEKVNFNSAVKTTSQKIALKAGIDF